jgi:hypothetical protein
VSFGGLFDRERSGLTRMMSTAQKASSVLSFSVRHKQSLFGLETTLADTEIEIGQLLDKCKDNEGTDNLAFYSIR